MISHSTNEYPVVGLDGYELEDVWLEQACSTIYRGHRKTDGLCVLIRLLRDPHSADGADECLKRDYRVAQLVSSKHAAKPFALEQTDRGPALIYVDEGLKPLEAVIRDAPLSIDAAIGIGLTLAKRIGELHKERLFHCNLNPVTVWLNDPDDFLISDFAYALHPAEDVTVAPVPGHEFIDIRYLSPEQTGRLERSVDQRADIYSLGIILFQILTGKVPFAGRDPLQIIDQHITKQPAFPENDKVPAGLRQVVLKTLAKGPESRYLSINGLIADLLECQAQWRSRGEIEQFEPGAHDVQGLLCIPQRLYGRERESATLCEKARDVRLSRSAMLLIKGAPGVGKSALIGQLESFIRNEKGRFACGKFDQYNRNIPYSALLQAFQQLVAQILSENNEQIEVWRSRIVGALGNNAGVVTDLIPELERLIGPQAAVPALPPKQARNRFNRVFKDFIQAFADGDQLLCVVMDDLQWVDRASLVLLAHLLKDPDVENIFFVGAYRDSEVGPEHRLKLMTHELMQAEADVEILQLKALTEHDVTQLIGDTFQASKSESQNLAHVLHAKTMGGPLHLTQLLHFLFDEGLISFDYGAGKWVWDLAQIRVEGVTGDVLDLLRVRLGALSEDVRNILSTAACLGSSFEAARLAVAAKRPPSEVLQRLSTAMEQGLVVVVEEHEAAAGLSSPRIEADQETWFRFVHDRIQQAALDCIPNEAQKAFRLQIGRRLAAEFSSDAELIPQADVLSNLNGALDMLVDDAEKQHVARLNLLAGRRARQLLAYRDALRYINAGLSLLDQTAWQKCHDLAYALRSEALECDYLSGNFDRADESFNILVTKARSKLEKARTYLAKILLDTSGERYEQAVKIGIDALGLYGVRYVRNPSRLHMLAELLQVRLRMRGRAPRDLIYETDIEDPEKVVALRILVALIPTAYFLGPTLLMFTGLKVVNYSLRYGISPISAGGFVIYGLGLSGVMNDHKCGYDFGHFALELAEKGKKSATICKVLFFFAAFIKLWRDPIDETFPLLDRVREMALEVGDHQYVNYAIAASVLGRVSRGTKLPNLLRECEEYWPFVQQSKDAHAIQVLTICKNYGHALQGRTATPHSLSNGAYDEDKAEAHYKYSGNFLLVSMQSTFRLQLACLFGRYEEALVLADRGEEAVRGAPGSITIVDHYFYRGLAAAVALAAKKGNTSKHRKVLRLCLARLHFFATSSQHNFLQHEVLLRAEYARANGELSVALKQYNEAIELAEQHNSLHLVGLANERAALCCLEDDQTRLASWYMRSAREAFDRWGAVAKVGSIEHDYSELLSSETSLPKTASSNATDRAVDSAVKTRADDFDIEAALKASRIITSRSSPDLLLTRLIQVIRLQAGAETALLLALEGDELRQEAAATTESNSLTLLPSQTTTNLGLFSPAVANYVRHTGDDLMLADANSDPRFRQCPYITDKQVKSVICSGIRYRDELLGVIYLEHNHLAGAFTEQKMEWLRILSGELALALWSGRLSRYRDYVHKFAPTEAFRRIDANPDNPDLEASDRDVSIMFADLVGYSRIAELLGNRQLAEFVNSAFSKFVDEIHRFEGVLLETRGDELFVLFADDDPKKHVWKAAKTALAIRRSATKLNEDSAGARPTLTMNVGINSGVASVGLQSIEASGAPRWHYGASGTVVNVAARIRALARDGDILISGESMARISDDFVFEDKGKHALKNINDSVQVFRLVKEQRDMPAL